jgi:transcriptional regulator with XRE-family HTH domain
MQLQEVDMSPLGETLRRARLDKGISIEDAERVTRIPRKYLEALELENFSILPAPVYARGFLRSYAGYLGLDPKELLPFFPVGHVEEPQLDPLPQVKQPHTWNMSGLVAMGVVAGLVLIVIALYSINSDSTAFTDRIAEQQGTGQDTGVITAPDAPAGPAVALPDLAGLSLNDAIDIVEDAGASYIIIRVQADVPAGQVVDHDPAPGTDIGPGSVVSISVSQ